MCGIFRWVSVLLLGLASAVSKGDTQVFTPAGVNITNIEVTRSLQLPQTEQLSVYWQDVRIRQYLKTLMFSQKGDQNQIDLRYAVHKKVYFDDELQLEFRVPFIEDDGTRSTRILGSMQIKRPASMWKKPAVSWSMRVAGDATATDEQISAIAPNGEIVARLGGYQIKITLESFSPGIPSLSYTFGEEKALTITLADGRDKRRYFLYPDRINPLRWYYLPERLPLVEKKVDGEVWPDISLLRYQRKSGAQLINGATLRFRLKISEDTRLVERLRQSAIQKSESLFLLSNGEAANVSQGDPIARETVSHS